MGGSRKGSNFEREICTTLSKWWSGGDRDDLFWRTAGSGARATVRGRKGKKTAGHCGDLTATDPTSQALTDLISFELKKGYTKVTVADLLDRPDRLKQGVWEEWIEKARRSMTNSSSFFWMVIHRRGGKEIMAYAPQELFIRLSSVGATDLSSNVLIQTSIKTGTGGWLGVVIVGCPLQHFLEQVEPCHVREVLSLATLTRRDK